MLRYLIKRFLFILPTLIGIATVVFFIIHLVPGDPVDLILGETALASDKEALREELGLNRPLVIQYLDFLTDLLQGDLGRSLPGNEPVLKAIISRLPATLELTLAALFMALLFAFFLGIWSALKKDSIIDQLIFGFSLLGISLPTFWLGPLLILLFSIELGWLPVSGRGGISSLILPALTLALSMSAILIRLLRTNLCEVINKDYIKQARAKGLSEKEVIIKHALPNALLPVITVIGLQFGALLTGTIIIETIFSWPGIGRLTFQAINRRDYALVQGCVLFIAFCYILINLLVDILYALIDPRITYE